MPTTIVAVNVSIAFGLLPGNKTTTADAIKAYVQSDLKSVHPTFLEFPRHLCPAKWRHLRRPTCRLIKALYGHPEAGVHWERHLAKIVIEMGGNAVPAHPSLFWFPNDALLLTIYVLSLLTGHICSATRSYPAWGIGKPSTHFWCCIRCMSICAPPWPMSPVSSPT